MRGSNMYNNVIVGELNNTTINIQTSTILLTISSYLSNSAFIIRIIRKNVILYTL